MWHLLLILILSIVHCDRIVIIGGMLDSSALSYLLIEKGHEVTVLVDRPVCQSDVYYPNLMGDGVLERLFCERVFGDGEIERQQANFGIWNGQRIVYHEDSNYFVHSLRYWWNYGYASTGFYRYAKAHDSTKMSIRNNWDSFDDFLQIKKHEPIDSKNFLDVLKWNGHKQTFIDEYIAGFTRHNLLANPSEVTALAGYQSIAYLEHKGHKKLCTKLFESNPNIFTDAVESIKLDFKYRNYYTNKDYEIDETLSPDSVAQYTVKTKSDTYKADAILVTSDLRNINTIGYNIKEHLVPKYFTSITGKLDLTYFKGIESIPDIIFSSSNVDQFLSIERVKENQFSIRSDKPLDISFLGKVFKSIQHKTENIIFKHSDEPKKFKIDENFYYLPAITSNFLDIEALLGAALNTAKLIE